MKKILLISLLSLHLFAADIYWGESYKDALEEAQESHKPILVFMSQVGCHSCEFMREKVFTDAKLRDYIAKNYVAVELDIHDNDAPKSLQIPVTPVFYFLKEDGSKKRETLIGGKTAPFFLKLLQ